MNDRTLKEQMRSVRAFTEMMTERQLCGCFSLDCTKHGNYVPQEIDMVDKIDELVQEMAQWRKP